MDNKPQQQPETVTPPPKKRHWEAILVTELKSGMTRTNKPYPIVIDQFGGRWNLFKDEKVELNKAYAFGYEFSDDGNDYKNIKQIVPLQKTFLVEALREVASKSELHKNFTVILSYIKDLVIADKIPYEKLFDETVSLYTKVAAKIDEEYDNIGKGIPKPSEIK